MGFSPTVTFGCTDFLWSFSTQHPMKTARDTRGLLSCRLQLIKSCWKNYSASPLPQSLCFDPVADSDIPIIPLGCSAGNPPPSHRAVSDEGTKKERPSINGQSVQSLQNELPQPRKALLRPNFNLQNQNTLRGKAGKKIPAPKRSVPSLFAG